MTFIRWKPSKIEAQDQKFGFISVFQANTKMGKVLLPTLALSLLLVL
jgi:hypothetical protein